MARRHDDQTGGGSERASIGERRGERCTFRVFAPIFCRQSNHTGGFQKKSPSFTPSTAPGRKKHIFSDVDSRRRPPGASSTRQREKRLMFQVLDDLYVTNTREDAGYRTWVKIVFSALSFFSSSRRGTTSFFSPRYRTKVFFRKKSWSRKREEPSENLTFDV